MTATSGAGDRCARDDGAGPCNELRSACVHMVGVDAVAKHFGGRGTAVGTHAFVPPAPAVTLPAAEHTVRHLGRVTLQPVDAVTLPGEVGEVCCGSCNTLRPWGHADCKECRGYSAGIADGRELGYRLGQKDMRDRAEKLLLAITGSPLAARIAKLEIIEAARGSKEPGK